MDFWWVSDGPGVNEIFSDFELQAVNIPLSAKGLDKLLDNLDKDGDGEVDFA